MKQKNTFWVLPVLFAALTLGCWFGTDKDTSLTERRKLAQMPKISWNSFLSGSFASNFESYTQDQFPFREGFRRAKALFSVKLLGRQDNNGIYESREGYFAQLEYPLNEDSMDYAAKRFGAVYDRYLSGSQRVYVAAIPDKSQFLPVPKLDFAALRNRLQEKMPYATFIDLSDTLRLDSFYRTDTHWRQEAIFEAAQTLSTAMGKPLTADDEIRQAKEDFLGVYAGQSALPMKGEKIRYLWQPAFENVKVWDGENRREIGLYDWEALDGRDAYEFFLSGSLSLVTLENPQAPNNRLILFRDSFGSSIAPYFLEQYREITLVDIRYLSPERLGKLVDFTDCDVLFLYSSLVLNNSETLK